MKKVAAFDVKEDAAFDAPADAALGSLTRPRITHQVSGSVELEEPVHNATAWERALSDLKQTVATVGVLHRSI